MKKTTKTKKVLKKAPKKVAKKVEKVVKTTKAPKTKAMPQLKEGLEMFMKKAKKPLIVILGPTASGKTDLSLKVAKFVDGEIVSTDSRQIYKEMEIGTAAITKKEQGKIPHHMLQIAKPSEIISLADYVDMALKVIDEILGRGKVPILVGGTGLYISAIIEGYEIQKIKPNKQLRDKLMKEAVENGNKYLHDKLKSVDPKAAAMIHPNNLHYVIRALEINLATGKNKTIKKKKKPPFDLFKVGIKWPREELYARIDKRADIQKKNGLVKEVEKLVKKKYNENLPSMTSLGVKEIIPFIRKEMTLSECMEILKKNTRRYAKRQMTWFNKYDNVMWLTNKELDECLKELLKN